MYQYGLLPQILDEAAVLTYDEVKVPLWFRNLGCVDVKAGSFYNSIGLFLPKSCALLAKLFRSFIGGLAKHCDGYSAGGA